MFLLAFSLFLVACGGDQVKIEKQIMMLNKQQKRNTEEAIRGFREGFSAAMVTDTGGIDDKSFNQSAWEGLEAWG